MHHRLSTQAPSSPAATPTAPSSPAPSSPAPSSPAPSSPANASPANASPAHAARPDRGRTSVSGAELSCEYLLVCEAHSTSLTDGRWHFSIEAADGSPVLEAGDEEFGDLNRLTLLAAVRGLESLDGPSAVKLLSNNRYVIRSLSDALPRWRRSDFVWEHFGRRIDIQHADLWRRIDRALAIHRVEACLVSSRLVSLGSREIETPRPGEAVSAGPDASITSGSEITSGVRSRFDAAHAGVPHPMQSHPTQSHPTQPRPTQSRRGTRRPGERPLADAESADSVSVAGHTDSSDRLRRWLMSSQSRGHASRAIREAASRSEPG